MFYDYDEACEATVTHRQARHEIINNHQLDPAEWQAFLAECGDRPTYSGRVVLDWLGY